jgi:hypothetical protein
MGPLLATGCTVKLCVTGGAAPKDASPGCETVMEHVPTPMMVTVVPAIVQTAGVVDAKLTASPEVAVAVRVNGATTKVTSLNAPNVVVLDADDPIK